MKIVLASLLALAAGCSKKSDDGDAPSKGGYAVVAGYHTGLLKGGEQRGLGTTHVVFSDDQCDGLPETFDLRPLGITSDVRNQGQCGSCWAHSMTEALESARKTAGYSPVKLSVQELVSNDSSNWGCSGGLMQPEKAYQVLHGQGLDSDFPYRAIDTQSKSIPVAAKAVSWEFVGQPNRVPTIKEVKCALFKRRSTPWVTVGASNAWGAPPSSESMAYNRCSNQQTNHAVTIVGWNKLGWVMQNSWGKDWGDQGRMTIPFGNSGTMGVCDNFGDEVAFVSVPAMPTPPGPTPPPGPGPGPTPPPGPCAPPKVKLPAEVQVLGETEVMLGVKAEAGVTYSWSVEGKVLGSESMLYVVPSKDAIYKISAKNACATVESQVRVRLVFTKPVE